MNGAPLPAPTAHGGDARRIARRLGVPRSSLLDLSLSVNPVAPDVRNTMVETLDALADYPDVEPATEALAAVFGVDSGRLVLTNGGSEAIALVARAMPVGSVEDPAFSLYRRHLREVRADAPRWRADPSSPLGRLAGADVSADVWDEAFWQLATGTWTRPDDGAWRVGSLTKLWACPGLRLGYVIAPDDAAAAAIRSDQPMWSVNGLACAAVPSLLAGSELPRWRDEVGERRTALVGACERLGLEAVDTAAPWVLVHGNRLRDRLLRHGVVVRDCSTFGLADTVRIAVPRDRDRPRLLHALELVAE